MSSKIDKSSRGAWRYTHFAMGTHILVIQDRTLNMPISGMPYLQYRGLDGR